MEESGQLDALTSFTTGKKPRYPLNRRVGVLEKRQMSSFE
jgi:hypothetical protein